MKNPVSFTFKHLAVAGLLALGLLFSPNATVAAAPIKATFLLPSSVDEHPFWDQYVTFMQAAADDLDIDLEILGSEHRFDVQEKAKELIERPAKPDYLLYIYHTRHTLDLLPLLEAAGIKSIISNTDITKSERRIVGWPRERFKHWIGHIFPDEARASRMLTDKLIATGFELGLTDNDGILHLVGIGGINDTTAAVHRKRGFTQAIGTTPKAVLDRYTWTNWDRKKAKAKAKRLLEYYPEARVYWGVHDDTALGILDAASELGFTPGHNFLTGSIDWTQGGIAAVEDGRILASVGGHFMEGAWTLIMLYDYHNGHDFADPSPTIKSEMRLLDAESFDTYLPVLARANWGRIDFRRFTRTHNPELRNYDFSPEAVSRQLIDR